MMHRRRNALRFSVLRWARLKRKDPLYAEALNGGQIAEFMTLRARL